MPAEDPRRVQGILESLSDDALRDIVVDAPSRGAWGWTGAGSVGGTTVFVKRIPVSDAEVAGWPSTRNLFRLPLAYQYGVGSAGFGASREEYIHRIVTDMVLDEHTDAFPRLHHSRVLPRVGDPWQMPVEREDYLATWGRDPAIAAFVDGRAGASHELWLVSEHLPHTLDAWLVDHQDRVDDVLEHLLDAAVLLRAHDMVHFDAHFANVVVDAGGERFCISDFGLALAASAELDGDERAFLAAHRHYDAGEIVLGLSGVVSGLYRGLEPDERVHVHAVCGLPDDADRGSVGAALVAHAGRLADEGLLALHPTYVAALERYRPVIEHMGNFLWTLSRDPAKRARHDDPAVVRLLRDCGVDVDVSRGS